MTEAERAVRSDVLRFLNDELLSNIDGVLDAIARHRREQSRREPTGPTPDLENTQRPSAPDHLIQPSHRRGCYIVRLAEQRVGIIELLDRIEAPLGRN